MKDAAFPTITPTEMSKIYENGNNAELIDVRPIHMFEQMRVGFARSLPFDVLDPSSFLETRGRPVDEPVYIICQAGIRSVDACEKFVAAGFHNVVNVDGGTLAWKKAGLPVVENKVPISVERQVQMAAGFSVLLGLVLGMALNPAFFGIAAFFGAGLAYSGVSGTCPLAMLLAKMPWN